jgi:hypothetical protein
MKNRTINHKFVEAIPSKVDPGTLYISMEFATAVHLCECGCGLEVVTPFSPTDWKLTYDGVSVSLHPSIGNWSFPCRSHYWIRQSRVEWAGDMPNQQISSIRETDKRLKQEVVDQPSWYRRAWAWVTSLFS